MSRYCPDIGSDIANIGSDIGKNDTISGLDDTISEIAISGHTPISVRVLSRYRDRYRDMITRLDCIFFVPSGAPLRDQHNDPADDDNYFNGDRQMDADEMRDYEDQDPHIPPTSTANLGPYARFLQNLPDYNDMTQEEFEKAFEALPLPRPGPSPPGISTHEAIEVGCIHRYTDIISDVVYDIVLYI